MRRFLIILAASFLMPTLGHGQQVICPKKEIYRFGRYYVYSTVKCTTEGEQCLERPDSSQYGYLTQVDTGCKHVNGQCQCQDNVPANPPLAIGVLELTSFEQRLESQPAPTEAAPDQRAAQRDVQDKSASQSFDECRYRLSDTAGRWEIVADNLLVKIELGNKVLYFMCLYGTYHDQGQKTRIAVAINCPDVPPGLQARNGRIVLHMANEKLTVLLQAQVKVGDTLRYLDFDQLAFVSN